MKTRFRIKDHWTEQRMFLRRSVVASCLMVLLVGVLIARLVQLQVVRYDYYSQLSQGNRVRVEPIPPNRGLILDRNGVVLAENLPAYQLELVAEQTPDIEDTLARLSALGLVEQEDIPQLIRTIRSRRKFESVPIRLRMSEDEVATFAVRRHDFPGVDIRPRLTRFYPKGSLAVHALGYVGAISEEDLKRIDRDDYAGTSLIGKLGVEAAYENELHGAPGYRQVLVNALGRAVEGEGALTAGLSSRPAVHGNDLILTLDVHVQQAAEAALQGRRGAIVALDPTNGDVLAFVSLPGFDPNRFGRGLTVAEYNELQTDIDRPLFNRALRGTYPPGSTVKPAIALAALANKVITAAHREFCPGYWRMPRVARPWTEGRGGVHGHVDMREAIARSCDVYFYDLADELGVDRMSGFLALFGFGRETGIDLPGEKPGVLPSREWKRKAFSRPEDQIWFPGDTINFGIGQGYMLVTPLQLAVSAALIAGRGRTFEPHLAAAIRDPRTGQIREFSPKPLPEVQAPPEQWRVVVEGMAGTMQGRGTARASAVGAPYTIAGKTGTAQVFSVALGDRYDEKTVAERRRDHSWFIAFAPVEEPRIAIAVLVENGGFGASAAAPVARQVMDAWLLRESLIQAEEQK